MKYKIFKERYRKPNKFVFNLPLLLLAVAIILNSIKRGVEFMVLFSSFGWEVNWWIFTSDSLSLRFEFWCESLHYGTFPNPGHTGHVAAFDERIHILGMQIGIFIFSHVFCKRPSTNMNGDTFDWPTQNVTQTTLHHRKQDAA